MSRRSAFTIALSMLVLVLLPPLAWAQEATFVMSSSFASGESIPVVIKNTSTQSLLFVGKPNDVACHRAFEILDSSGTQLNLSSPNIACTLDYATFTVKPGQTQVLGTWDQ